MDKSPVLFREFARWLWADRHWEDQAAVLPGVDLVQPSTSTNRLPAAVVASAGEAGPVVEAVQVGEGELGALTLGPKTWTQAPCICWVVAITNNIVGQKVCIHFAQMRTKTGIIMSCM